MKCRQISADLFKAVSDSIIKKRVYDVQSYKTAFYEEFIYTKNNTFGRP